MGLEPSNFNYLQRCSPSEAGVTNSILGRHDKFGRINSEHIALKERYTSWTGTSKSVASNPYPSVNRWRAA